LSINTPESTGKIEEYGKAASNFTREKLSAATSIIVESDDSNWNVDSTGDRHLVWVWYKTAENEEYRNLNIEILQNGLAIANSSAQGRYGSTCMKAINQAKAHKLNVYSGQKDPDFYYGEAVELTLKELRTNTEAYNGIKVAFNGIITTNSDNSVYVESYDAETDMYYGFSVYYGFGLSGEGLDILSVGNEARIVGTVQYYEVGGTYQVAGLSYRMMKPDDPTNIQKLSDGHKPAYVLTDADTFANGKVEAEVAGEKKEFAYAEMALGSSIEMQNLAVKDIYTTTNEESSSKGAMTMTCEVDDIQVDVRTVVLTDADGKLITEDTYKGKTIDVKGIVDYFDGTYQIKVFSADDIIIK
jgi:micrococcal nuclease